MRGSTRSLALVPFVALFAVGCALSRKEAGAGARDDAPPPAASAPAAPAPAQAQAGADNTRVDERRIVKKASLELEVGNVGDAQAAATRIAEREGGFVASTERLTTSDDDRKTEAGVTLTLSVPAA